MEVSAWLVFGHSYGLHEGIKGGWPYEGPVAFLQVFVGFLSAQRLSYSPVFPLPAFCVSITSDN
ncbi:hypothetical protein GCM10007094_38950 [Pseudovibrio japonicus]|uniref:Uncharacterized protein n=1 Tax=Pseudovibrio japonicus TaxID=366534 RepID=A0ABQ3ELH8_9HYPH|nr:hypothetical protein GCM10007094_38950 [Pseudovibrio japonicus]